MCSIAEFGGDVTDTEVSVAYAGHDDEVLCEGGKGSVFSVFSIWSILMKLIVSLFNFAT